jgi:hypothetical protein
MGVILVIKRHMPELSVSLPTIRHTFEMHSQTSDRGLQEEHSGSYGGEELTSLTSGYHNFKGCII